MGRETYCSCRPSIPQSQPAVSLLLQPCSLLRVPGVLNSWWCVTGKYPCDQHISTAYNRIEYQKHQNCQTGSTLRSIQASMPSSPQTSARYCRGRCSRCGITWSPHRSHSGLGKYVHTAAASLKVWVNSLKAQATGLKIAIQLFPLETLPPRLLSEPRLQTEWERLHSYF